MAGGNKVSADKKRSKARREALIYKASRHQFSFQATKEAMDNKDVKRLIADGTLILYRHEYSNGGWGRFKYKLSRHYLRVSA